MKRASIFFMACLVCLLTSCGGMQLREQASLIGQWVEPVPGNESAFQGFSLESGGLASSVNMATLQYQTWRRDGNRLVLSGKSIGNHQTINFEDSYVIKKLTSRELILQKGNGTFVFQRKN